MDVFNFFFQDSPKITKILTISCVLISIGTWFNIITPLDLYYNNNLIFKKFQIWRVFTNIFYFGDFSLSLIFHLILFFRNSNFLEKSIFRGNSSDYLYFLIISIFILSCIGPNIGIVFMSNSICFTMTYYWGRKSKNTLVNVAGLFTLRAPYLPWFYLILSFLWDIEFKHDLLGMFVGHLYFFFKDIFPRIKKSKGFDLFKTPKILNVLCERLNLNSDVVLIDEMNDIIF